MTEDVSKPGPPPQDRELSRIEAEAVARQPGAPVPAAPQPAQAPEHAAGDPADAS